jgi:hypothetical protein
MDNSPSSSDSPQPLFRYERAADGTTTMITGDIAYRLPTPPTTLTSAEQYRHQQLFDHIFCGEPLVPAAPPSEPASDEHISEDDRDLPLHHPLRPEVVSVSSDTNSSDLFDFSYDSSSAPAIAPAPARPTIDDHVRRLLLLRPLLYHLRRFFSSLSPETGYMVSLRLYHCRLSTAASDRFFYVTPPPRYDDLTHQPDSARMRPVERKRVYAGWLAHHEYEYRTRPHRR